MKFRRDSDEEMCGQIITVKTSKGESDGACMRTAGHPPPCIAWAGEAAEADGVCHVCRAPAGQPHRADCVVAEASNPLIDRHRILAVKSIVDVINDEERAELEGIRRSLDINEAFDRIDVLAAQLVATEDRAQAAETQLAQERLLTEASSKIQGRPVFGSAATARGDGPRVPVIIQNLREQLTAAISRAEKAEAQLAQEREGWARACEIDEAAEKKYNQENKEHFFKLDDRIVALLAERDDLKTQLTIGEAKWRDQARGDVIRWCDENKDPVVRELSQSLPGDLRDAGWSVAVHNDYRQNGERHTFWLFTKEDRAIKGEGKTDAEALNQIRAKIERLEKPVQSPLEVPADRLGRLGQDGSVRLPQAVIDRVGLRSGDFVYFVDEEDGIRILTPEQMDATLTTSGEK